VVIPSAQTTFYRLASGTSYAVPQVIYHKELNRCVASHSTLLFLSASLSSLAELIGLGTTDLVDLS
jgi:hypothetical protein